MDIIRKTPEGDKPGNTAGVQMMERELPAGQPRRVQTVDLDGPLGEFLAEALCYLAPDSFNAKNWKSKLSTFITSRTASFICYGRAVALAYLEQDPMTGHNEAKGMFALCAEGATEEDINIVLRQQKQWARDLDVGFRPPHKEFCALSQSKLALLLKAEKREELIVKPLEKKK
jgi:hypothetical protein